MRSAAAIDDPEFGTDTPQRQRHVRGPVPRKPRYRGGLCGRFNAGNSTAEFYTASSVATTPVKDACHGLPQTLERRRIFEIDMQAVSLADQKTPSEARQQYSRRRAA
jgi:hypothetical protein